MKRLSLLWKAPPAPRTGNLWMGPSSAGVVMAFVLLGMLIWLTALMDQFLCLASW